MMKQIVVVGSVFDYPSLFTVFVIVDFCAWCYNCYHCTCVTIFSNSWHAGKG